ncbi:hypothetical protein [Candidatus Magnetobacterium casense]|uniref:hypothetical protein n=1 Tax=Candidatus Magnetobacterium casense TaxID=1455061 RepID=UPI00058E81D4|nr:hypothetical protein [Candidatus Magnetobacterium casensis]
MLIESISWLLRKVQRLLFPELEEICTDPITEKQKHLITILEIVQIEKYMWWVDNQCKGMLWQDGSTGDVYIWFMDGTTINSGGYADQGVPSDWSIY